MRGWLWAVAGVGAIVLLFLVQRIMKLARQVNQLKREQYYTGSRLKQISEEIRDMVEPLRLQVAKIAAGAVVPQDLILAGRRYLDVSPEEAQRVIEQEAKGRSGRVVLVDVRSAKEYAAKRMPGAKLVPFEELERRYKEDIPETAEKVLIYCAGGEQSRFACDFLSRQGYTNLYHVKGGLQGWRGPMEGEGHLTLIQIQSR